MTGKSANMVDKPFSPSHINQMLVALSAAGLVYKNRHGKYSFAVPLLGRFIARQRESYRRFAEDCQNPSDGSPITHAVCSADSFQRPYIRRPIFFAILIASRLRRLASP